jgi:hypothetical protein
MAEGLSIMFSIVVPALIIIYLIRLEVIGCECAMDFKRNYIILFHTFEVIFYSLVFLSKGRLLEYLLDSRYFTAIFSVYAIGTLVNIVFSILYIVEIAMKKCRCAETFIAGLMIIFNFFYLLGIVSISLLTLVGYTVKSTFDS